MQRMPVAVVLELNLAALVRVVADTVQWQLKIKKVNMIHIMNNASLSQGRTSV